MRGGQVAGEPPKCSWEEEAKGPVPMRPALAWAPGLSCHWPAGSSPDPRNHGSKPLQPPAESANPSALLRLVHIPPTGHGALDGFLACQPTSGFLGTRTLVYFAQTLQRLLLLPTSLRGNA